MTEHEKALEAAELAMHATNGVRMSDGLPEAITAYLSAMGVRDLAGLVAATKALLNGDLVDGLAFRAALTD